MNYHKLQREDNYPFVADYIHLVGKLNHLYQERSFQKYLSYHHKEVENSVMMVLSYTIINE